MTPESQKLKESWKNASSDEKFALLLVGVILLFVFFPWASYSYGTYGTVVYFSQNGFRSYGQLTFLGSIAFLIWNLLPMAGINIPDIGVQKKTGEKILSLVMLAGPVLWLLSSEFYWGSLGVGFWICFILSALLVYLNFTGMTFSELRKKFGKK